MNAGTANAGAAFPQLIVADGQGNSKGFLPRQPAKVVSRSENTHFA
jgi:hypothetical protein